MLFPTLFIAAGLLPSAEISRRSAFRIGVSAAGNALLLGRPSSSAAYTAPPGFESKRIEGIGNGFDILSYPPLRVPDVLYPPFLNGTWEFQRVVTSVEGDAGQARGAFRLLGGDGDFGVQMPEVYPIRYLDTRTGSITGLDGRKYYGVVLDRGFELDSRTRGARVDWDVTAPDRVSYERTTGGLGSAAVLTVVQRSVEQPSESSPAGWGSNELLRISTSSVQPLVGELKIDYAVRRLQRFKRGGVDADGNRLVEGLEIVKTYRVLDGVAGIEFPTSSTRSALQLRRPA